MRAIRGKRAHREVSHRRHWSRVAARARSRAVRDIGFWIALALVLGIALRMLLAAKKRISGADAHAKIEAGGVLVDVRSEGEFHGGGLPGAKNIPVQSLGARMGELPKDRPIVVYCASGMRSASAASKLRANGYDAYDLGPGARW